MAIDPNTDASVGWISPEFTRGMEWLDVGSYGLRQFSGWVREEFLTDLVGREGARVFREMADNNATIGSIVFAIQQAIRKVDWRIEPASDKAAAKREAEFVEQVMGDMTHTWEDFITEVLSMLVYGYSYHEIVYKRRMGRKPESRPGPKPNNKPPASSRYDDGRIGWRRLPIRSQDTIIKWFFDENGQTQGVTQQPWVGMIIDLPIEKGLLFRPVSHKNNPEGRSVLRNSYRSYFFTKRLEEQEAIMAERFNGFPVLYIPSTLINDAFGTNSSGGAVNPQAFQAYQQYKKLVTNVRIDEQMGAILPSDPYIDPLTGHPTSVRQYEFQLLTPGASSRAAASIHSPAIERYKLDILMTVLADFIHLGHEVRGTNNLGSIKVDMFYSAVQGWTKGGIASVLNMYALPRLWKINNLDPNLMPEISPDLPHRIDLDGLGTFIANISGAGLLAQDEELRQFLRDAAGLPEEEADAKLPLPPGSNDTASVKKYIAGKLLNKMAENQACGA